MQYNKLTKKELEDYGRTLGIELDKRKKKNDLIAAIKKAEKATAKKKSATKKKSVIKGQPVKQSTKINTVTKSPKPKSIIERIRHFFNL